MNAEPNIPQQHISSSDAHYADEESAVAHPNGLGNDDDDGAPALSPDIAMLLAQSMHYVSDAVKLVQCRQGQFIFHYINQSALNMFQTLGFHSETLLQKTPTECFPTTQAQELIRAYSSVVESKREQTFEITLQAPNGTTRLFRRQLIPLQNERKEVTFIVSIMHDISEQSFFSKYQQRLALLLENSPGIVMFADMSSIYFFNPTAIQRLGIGEQQERTRYTPYDFFADPNMLGDVILPSVRTSDTWKGDCTMRTLTGNTFPASVVVMAQRQEDEQIEEYIFICIDKTEHEAAQQRLFESERMAQLIIENVQQHAFIQLDKRGTIISWNQGAERIFEYDADGAIGHHVGMLELMPDDELLKAGGLTEGFTGSLLSQVLDTEEFSYESRRITLSGRSFYTENTLTAVYDHTGRHVGFSLIVHDVSEIRRMKEELRRKRREGDIFIDNAADIITRYNPQKVCVFVNRKAESVFNVPRSSIVGLSLHAMMQTRPTMQDVDHLLNRVIETGSAAQGRGSFDSPQGKLTFALKAVPEFDAQNRLETIVVIATNITSEVAAQELLLKTLAEEKDVQEFKMRFQKVISHELRTPLAGVKMSADIVERYMESLTHKELLHHTNEINASVREIETLLDNLLLTMKVETHTLKPTRTSCDVIELCQQEIETFGRAHRKTCTIEFASPSKSIMLLLDKYLVHIILRNCLTNAINYSDEHCVVHLWVGMLHNEVCITIHNTGIGIVPKDSDMIFQPFFRGKNAENIPGIGMGLFIAKHCVELHGGTIDIESTPGKETTVTILLPLVIE